MPERIQLQRTRGWRKPDGAVVVSRPSRWGNPFRVGDLIRDPGYWNTPACPYDGVMPPGEYNAHTLSGEPYVFRVRPVRDRADAVALFEAFVEFHNDNWPVERIRAEIGGRDLACWCALPGTGEPDHCHARILLDLANPTP